MVSALVPKLVLPGGLTQGVRHGGHNCISKDLCQAPPCVVLGISDAGAHPPSGQAHEEVLLAPMGEPHSKGVGVLGKYGCWPTSAEPA